MTRRFVYGIGLWTAAAATALTLASIIVPRWLSLYPEGTKRTISYGLHSWCSIIKGTCEEFPKFDKCLDDQRSFCSMWRTIGFLMSFAVVLELATIVAHIVIIAGGKQRRDQGWKVLSGLLFLVALAQCASMAIVAYLFNHDSRFFEGWQLDASWIMCTVSWVILFLSGIGFIASAYLLPEEGDYELIGGDEDDYWLRRDINRVYSYIQDQNSS